MDLQWENNMQTTKDGSSDNIYWIGKSKKFD